MLKQPSLGIYMPMMESLVARFGLLVACASLFVVCDALAAHWGKNGSTTSLIVVIFLAPFSYILFGFVNKKYPLAIASAWIMLALCITTVLVGYFFFNDQLTTRQFIGLGMALVASGLMVL